MRRGETGRARTGDRPKSAAPDETGAAWPLARVPRRISQGFTVYRPGEVRADLAVHLVGLAGAVAIAPALLATAARDGSVGSLAVTAAYVAALVAMLIASAAYNLSAIGPGKRRLRKLDQVAIFLKILAVYGVFTWFGTTGPWGVATFAVVLALAVVGIALVVTDTRPRPVLRLAIFLAIGWAGLASVVSFRAAVSPAAFRLVVAGGLLYSLGIVFHVARGRLYHKAAWHAAVVAASACFAAAIFLVLDAVPAR